MQYHLLATSVGLVFVYVVGQGNFYFVYRLVRDDGITHPLLYRDTGFSSSAYAFTLKSFCFVF